MSAGAAHEELGWMPTPADPSPRALAFFTFHQEHPDVFRTLLRLGRERLAELRADGEPLRLGAKALWERMRWDFRSTVVGGVRSKPVFNNTFTAHYARLLIETYPEEFKGVFTLRELRS